ncbi:hypothetical protein C7M84_000080 [Penaeus vannamei]|uniref:Beta-hexosaminidase n=1 Tax=Penaeus vannamei TaxID=6689 RepID=A0A3R7PYM6_PENVA|nr:hypothetical protein C7M84_000080 [Penaeus vannamei]
MKVFVAAALLALAAAEGYFRLPNPYSYSCHKGLCLREESTGIRRRHSLEECQITCGKYGSIWPQPTGKVELSNETVSFSPLHMRVTKAATSDNRVARMLDNAIQHFTRTIHFLHPDFPQTEKQPLTPEDFENTGHFSQKFQNEDPAQQEQYRQRSEYDRNQLRQRPRYSREEPESFIRRSPFLRKRSNPGVESHNVNIEITVTASDHKLRLDTDESYNLVIQTVGDETTATILASTYYGARHALETLSQLIAYDDINNAVQVAVMLRFKMLRASGVKVVGFRRKVYYPEDIREIVEYANLRGISVIPEIGGPAHNAAGWQWAQKEGKGKLALCTDSNEPWFELSKEPPSGQINPINPEVYPILGELYRDLMDYFDPEMVHMGGDDVSFKCWQSSEEIQQYLSQNKRESTSREYFELWNTYQSSAFNSLQEAAQGRQVTPIIHSSSFARNYVNKDAYIIQLNENAADTAIADYINNGYKVIFSNQDQWNLDCVTSSWIGEKANDCPQETPTWESFYRNSPLDILSDQGISNARSDLVDNQQSSKLRDLVLGGEATLQSHEVDNNGLQSKIWPRLSAFAERLWTDPTDSSFLDAGFTQKRLNIQRTRMVSRGIRADPLQPEYCMQDESACYSKEQHRARTSFVN